MKLSSKTDRRLIYFCLFLLCLQGSWLWHRFISPNSDFDIFKFINNGFNTNTSSSDRDTKPASIIAGRLLIQKGSIKYKHQGDLFWQNAEDNQIIYYYDSLLSSTQSLSSLELRDNKSITLNENTLITIEPEHISFLQEQIHLKLTNASSYNNNTTAAILNLDFKNKNYTAFNPTIAEKTETENILLYNYGSEKITSSEKTIVDQTPTMKLLTPFDRDRVLTNQNITMTWSYVPDTDKYLLKIKNVRTGQSLKKMTIENSFDISFKTEQEIEWTVVALNKKGRTISTITSSRFFVSNSLIRSPKLNLVEIRRINKKRKPSSIQKSQSSVVCFLSWQHINDADHYNIEIARTSDFKQPILSQNVIENNFQWPIQEAGIFYWRVSAGNKSKMGEFSTAEKIRLTADIINDRKNWNQKMDPDSERESIETDTDKLLADKPKLILEDSLLEKTTTKKPRR